mgnify:CR=1 FL=1|jgi:hypothetical protein
MRKITVSVQVDAEKLRAIQFYAGRKNSAVETELEDCVNKTYEKCVHAQTREYIESIAAPARHSGPRRPASAAEEAENER